MLLTALGLFSSVHNLFITAADLFTNGIVKKKCIGVINSIFESPAEMGRINNRNGNKWEKSLLLLIKKVV